MNMQTSLALVLAVGLLGTIQGQTNDTGFPILIPNIENSTGFIPEITPGLSANSIRDQFEAIDFVYPLAGVEAESNGLGGTIRALSVSTLPSLEGQGIAYTLFEIEPCGINLPHVHPRATEMIYVDQGENLRTAFVEENGGRLITNDITRGQVTFFPQGLVHYQQNLGCSPVVFLSALNSEDPGVLSVASQTFLLTDNEALSSTLDQVESLSDRLRDGLPAGPAEGRRSCLRRCELWNQARQEDLLQQQQLSTQGQSSSGFTIQHSFTTIVSLAAFVLLMV
jgi:oxalate decarboxylase/phosphoglucose isomerase-like protein (cupin superfamily)